MHKSIVISILLFLIWFSAYAIELRHSGSIISIEGSDIEVLIDKNRVFDINSLPPGSFIEYSGKTPNFGFFDGTVWLKIKLFSENGFTGIIELANPNLDKIEYFTKNSDDRDFKLSQTTGDYFHFAQRLTTHRFYQFPFEILKGDSLHILFRIDNHGDQFYIPINVATTLTSAKRDYNEQMIFGIYYGILIFVFLLNLFIFLVIGERANLYYLFYILGLIFLQAGLSGYGFQFIWSNSPYLANHLLPLLASFSVFSLLKFTQWFLDLKLLLPRWNRIFTYISWLILLNLVLSAIRSDLAYMYSILIINLITLSLNFIIIPIAIYAIHKKFKPGRFFLLAFLVLILSVFGFILRNFGWVASNFLTNYSLQIGSAVEVVLLSFAIVDKFKTFRDQAYAKLQEMTDLKSRQNEMLEMQVNERTFEINRQKEVLSQKNTEILSSITYAKRIQNAFLPPVEYFEKYLPESFIFYLPKDIVAGDFYWMEVIEDKVFFAVCDCTGHGVPGAMVSVVCFNALQKSVLEFGLTNPGLILDKVTDLVIETFARGNEEVKDGMDIALCSWDPKTKTIEYAGANNPLYLFRNNEMTEIKANKQPIGQYSNRSPFTNHIIICEPNDQFYIFSDGFPDQFGGEGGKKFMYRPFKELLARLTPFPADQQLQKIQESFATWKGEYEQIDDVCVIGVRF